ERLGDIQAHAVGLVQFVSRPGLEPVGAPALEFVVQQLDDVVEENLDRHGCRVDLRNEVFSTYDRNRATSRKRDFTQQLGHYRGLSASGIYLSANAAVISNSRSRVFFCNSCWVSIMPPFARYGSYGMNSTVAPDCANRSVRYVSASRSYLLRLSFRTT